MFSKLRLLGLLFLLLLIPQTLPSQNTISAQDDGSDAPWLYYSYSTSAFRTYAIQRADGSDLRVLPPLESEGQRASYPEWSVTGDWFLWTTSFEEFSGGGSWIVGSKLYTSTIDGSQQVTVFADFDDIRSAWWMLSPDGNDVLGYTRLSYPSSENPDPCETLYLVDVESDEIIASEVLECHDDLASHNIYRPTIAANHEWAKLQQGRTYGAEVTVQYFLVNANGDILNREYQPCALNYFLPEWHQDDRLVRFDYDTQSIILEDISTSTLSAFPIDAPDIQRIQWSSDGTQAIVTAYLDCDTRETDLWHLSIQDSTLTQIEPETRYLTLSNWSPDSRYSVVQNLSENIFLLDTSDLSLQALNIQIGPKIYGASPYIRWLPDSSAFFVVDDSRTYLSVSVPSGDIETYPDMVYETLQISPDGETFLYRSQTGCESDLQLSQFDIRPICVESTFSIVSIVIPYAIEDHRVGLDYFDADWYNASDWVILTEYWGAGGEQNPIRNILNRRTGEIYERGGRWLPDRIVERDPLPGIPVCNASPPPQFHVGMRGIVSPDNQNRVNLRDIPNGDLVTQLDQGTSFTIIGTAECHNDLTWWEIQTDDGTTGWVAEGIDELYFIAPYVDEFEGTEALCPNAPLSRISVGDTAFATFNNGGNLNVRSEAGGAQVTQLAEGDQFSITGGPICQGEFTWWEIETPNGTTGWVAEGNPDRYFIAPIR